jgi:hypothetical protein
MEALTCLNNHRSSVTFILCNTNFLLHSHQQKQNSSSSFLKCSGLSIRLALDSMFECAYLAIFKRIFFN